MTIAIALTLHLIAINVWVGGMFFVVVVFGRSISDIEQAIQLTTWRKVLSRFFSLVWAALFILIITGVWMIAGIYGGLGKSPLYISFMASLGLLMMAIFIFTYFVPYKNFKQALEAQDFDVCHRNLGKVRLLGKVNMLIGLCVVTIIGAGPHYLV